VEESTAAPTRNNHLRALQEIFQRRLEKGQWLTCACLGWSEFVPSYLGPLRPETQVEKSLHLTVPSMLHSVFDRPVDGKVAPYFRQNVKIRAGVLDYVV